MTLQFTKMHGLGNDFMVIDAIRQAVTLNSTQIKTLSRRDTGIGFDQCLLVELSQQQGIDFFYRIFNADGQEVGQCGNGARCLARFLHHYELTNQRTITVATKTTRMTLHLHANEQVTLDLPPPKFHPHTLPFNTDQEQSVYSIYLPDQTQYTFHIAQVGNPHVVLIVEDLDKTDVQTIGKAISEHPSFPLQTNVGFMQILSPDSIRLRVYERGCGETKACGSGAVAAAAIGRRYHQLSEIINVHLPGGTLKIQWSDFKQPIYQTGPAVFVYEGQLIPS